MTDACDDKSIITLDFCPFPVSSSHGVKPSPHCHSAKRSPHSGELPSSEG
eukprot:CAMPEP_0198370400 /NCGR_PEP_ID=MMETSP1450-20131203/156698_1 /TAXON_ID=753684 ORGANISM="Madagascaria erythrocladiodes, Strain CCMP3234" /NCGR_SAMPLE_ID=MMETSP1450 /ASSEMBLY_ACC=CAM_ASM_001115 /LENGTH=49 /DNA_ID=CAMNT_0044077941 /DNA_START=286 /DNA_END=435 /DNA_ORIENTATION=+